MFFKTSFTSLHLNSINALIFIDGGFRITYYKDDDIGLRIYQEKVQKGVPKDEVKDYNRFIEYYLNEGVNSEEAQAFAHFSILVEGVLKRIEREKDPWQECMSDMYPMHFFKVNNEGYITELHLHYSGKVYLTIFPKMLRSLKFLEVITFPNNLIKEIPEWILDFKFLRVLDVHNPRPNPHIPDSIKPFIDSLESFNGR